MVEQLRPVHSSAGNFGTNWDLCTALRETWCGMLTAVVLLDSKQHGISSIIFVFVTVTRFATSQHGMYWSKSLCICTYIESGCRRYFHIIGDTPGDADWQTFEMNWEAMVEGKSGFHHNHHLVWQENAAGVVRRWHNLHDGLSDGESIFGRP